MGTLKDFKQKNYTINCVFEKDGIFSIIKSGLKGKILGRDTS